MQHKTKVMSKEDVVLVPMEQTQDEIRLSAAIKKLKKFDSDIVSHLEQLADLAERNKPLFNIGLNFLKRR
jgi:hypothetical protein